MTTIPYASPATSYAVSPMWKRLAVIAVAWAVLATALALWAIFVIGSVAPGFWRTFFRLASS